MRQFVRRLHNIKFETDYSLKPPQSILLSKALEFVPEFGWTRDSLVKASISLGYTPVTHGLFPRGPIELVEYFIQNSTDNLKHELYKSKDEYDKLGTTGRIRMACIARLKMTIPYIKDWPTAVSLMMQPQNLPNTMEHLSRLVDEMWWLAGDTSVDLNWYSKRMLLAGVYTSTEMFMTTDTCPDYQYTWNFLDRRLQDVATVGMTIGQGTQLLQYGLGTAKGLWNSCVK